MKTTLAAKAIPVILACSILAIFLVPAGFANKGSYSNSEPAAATSCINTADKFKVFPHVRLNTNKKGSVAGFEILLSDANGFCTVMLYSSLDGGYEIDLDDPDDSFDGGYALR